MVTMLSPLSSLHYHALQNNNTVLLVGIVLHYKNETNIKLDNKVMLHVIDCRWLGFWSHHLVLPTFKEWTFAQRWIASTRVWVFAPSMSTSTFLKLLFHKLLVLFFQRQFLICGMLLLLCSLLWGQLTSREHLLFYGRLKNLKGTELFSVSYATFYCVSTLMICASCTALRDPCLSSQANVEKCVNLLASYWKLLEKRKSLG